MLVKLSMFRKVVTNCVLIGEQRIMVVFSFQFMKEMGEKRFWFLKTKNVKIYISNVFHSVLLNDF